MNANYTKHSMKVVASLLAASMMASTSYADDCLIKQNKNTQSILVNAGKVGQSFTPCESGTLDFIGLQIESASEKSFTAVLAIKDGNTILTEQQIVVPAAGQASEQRTWLVNPPVVTAGQRYTFEVKGSANDAFTVQYQSSTPYEEGGMILNGMGTTGDLAFEAGVRAAQNNPNCFPDFRFEDGVVNGDLVVSQSFELCEGLRMDRLRFNYRGGRVIEGRVQVRKAEAPEGEIIGSLKFTAAPANPIGETIAASDQIIELQSGVHYELNFVMADGNPIPADFQLWYGDNDPYDRGRLSLTSGESDRDLSFSLIEAEDDSNPSVDDGVEVDDQPQFAVFLDYPEHECTRVQPYYNHTHNFSGVTLTFEAPVCDDGKLEAIYFPGTIEGKGGEVTFQLRNNQGSVLRSGPLTASETDGLLSVDLQNANAMMYYKYEIEVIVPEGVNLRIPSSDNPDHAGMRVKVNGTEFARHISYAVGMKPFAFDFDSADNDRLIEVNAWPNPFASDLNIAIKGLEGRAATVSIYNFQGHEVYRTQLDGRSDLENLQLTSEMMPQRGYYTLRVDYGDHVQIETLVKQ